MTDSSWSGSPQALADANTQATVQSVAGVLTGTPVALSVLKTYYQTTPTITSPTIATGATLSFLTATRIPYAGTAGALADDSKFIWDGTNHRLGIGGAPSDLFHIAATGNANALRVNDTTGFAAIGAATVSGFNLYVKAATSGQQLQLDVASGQRYTQCSFANNGTSRGIIRWDDSLSYFEMGGTGGETHIIGSNAVMMSIHTSGVRVATNAGLSTWMLDVVGPTVQVAIGSNVTNSTTKAGVFGAFHYTNAEEPLGLISSSSTSSTGIVNFGGGNSALNACTQGSFFAAANFNTVTGTEMARYTTAGWRLESGVSANPTNLLDVIVSDAGTTTVVNAAKIGHKTSGTAAAGLGVGHLWTLDSTTTADQNAGLMSYEWVVATHASRTARGKILVYDTAAREAIRVEASGSAAMIGFLGAAAVAQQVSGANLTNSVTSGGTDDTVTDWTNLTVYATDAGAIRNAVYQLARKLKQVNDAMRLYGLLT